ncbi:MAG TPA: 3-hydroxyacyl-CoA dehydrogenase family protein [Bacilli bacterium]|nr:3-hydroxyacyl-CoA dehydrogenase family protein [Bacilli bacterium]
MTAEDFKRVLVLGDGTVAEELALELEERGYDVTSFIHAGPMEAWNEKPFRYLETQFESELEMGEFDAAVLAFTSAKESLRRVVLKLQEHLYPETLVLTSAMSYSTSEIASWFDHPERVVGFSFLPPLADVKLIEVARALQTSDYYAQEAEYFLNGLERELAWIGDSAGMALPRMVSLIINEAVTALMEDVATAEDLDTAMRLGVNYPHGPLMWADRIGLDQVYATLSAVFEEQGEDRYRPAPLLRRMVLARRLGVRTGSGFYNYEGVEENA